MIKVAALTSGRDVPSARFRVRQHIEPLQRAGICVREHLPLIEKYAPPPPFLTFSNRSAAAPLRIAWKCAKILARIPGVIGSWKARITWLEREMHPGWLTFEPLLKRPLLFDVDDAIWLTPPIGRRAAIKIAKMADVLIAGNHFIAEWFSTYAKDVRIVPTAVDTDRIRPRHFPGLGSPDRGFVVGWTGTSSNYDSLYQIEKALEQFLTNRNAELVVIADQPPRFSHLKPERVRYVKWSPDMEIRALEWMDVGLMPLPFNEWSMGKCSFKMLQYMAAGLPVVVSPVGMNAEVMSMGDIGLSAVTPADWYEALTTLYDDRAFGYRCGAEGRLIVEKRFSRSVVSMILADIFREFV